MDVKQYLKNILSEAIGRMTAEADAGIEIVLERPRQETFGDISTTVAMSLAKKLKKQPRELAQEIIQQLKTDARYLENVTIAGPGFINFTMSQIFWQENLRTILEADTDFGTSDRGQGVRYQFEFVSANPTGPLNIVSARAAAVGDVLASLHAAAGFAVQREYLVNDGGRQVRLLGASLSARYMELLQKTEPFPEEGYQGEYVRDLARQIIEQSGTKYAELPLEVRQEIFSALAVDIMVQRHREAMEKYRVHFDVWFSENDLRKANEQEQVLADLRARGHIYEKDGAVWFRSTTFGDEKDRVLVTSQGEATYFLMDIAYHRNKYSRGFQIVHDLWGPDHHGYIERMSAAIQALGHPAAAFRVSIIQQVNLLRAGQVVKMSKRAGQIIEMDELIDEVGVDAARFFFVDRRISTHLDFDIDLAKKQSDENPVYYLQYAHARIFNILRFAQEKGHQISQGANLTLLAEPAEIALIKKLLEFPQVIDKAAELYEPQRLTTFLREVAALFHRFYHDHRVVTEDSAMTEARLLLTEATRIVLRNGFKILGITAPERM